jgi:hypothetical protein
MIVHQEKDNNEMTLDPHRDGHPAPAFMPF